MSGTEETESTRSCLPVNPEMSPPPGCIRDPDWRQRLRAWFRQKKLEYELRKSRKFQAYLEKVSCPHLAALETESETQIQRQIRDLEK